jgi:hypothetical protein
MKIYLVGLPTLKGYNSGLEKTVSYNLLEAYPTMNPWLCELVKSNNVRSFMLDSGAFSFLNGNKKSLDALDSYIKGYIHLIKEMDIHLFFEMDLDGIIPLTQIEQIREEIERGTGKKCIPVWHKSRGIQYFSDICQDYDYVAVGGLVTGEIPKNKYNVFSDLIKIAHKSGAKIHGLGVNSPPIMKKYPFDSVDGTGWIKSSRFGRAIHFMNGGIKSLESNNNKKFNYKISDSNNFLEWIKFANYMEYDYVYR